MTWAKYCIISKISKTPEVEGTNSADATLTSGATFQINIINKNKTITSKSFEYKTKSIGSTPKNNKIFDITAVASPKYLSNFWRSLDLTLINCKIKLNF